MDRGPITAAEPASTPSRRAWFRHQGAGAQGKPDGRLWATFCAAAFGVVAWSAWVVFQRVRFPWDLYVWSESPFLTNLLKLTAGLPLYSPPADANSFVYSPGLEYLTFALLRPFGLQLDIRYCRGVSIGCAALAALAFARCAQQLLREFFPEDGGGGRLFLPASAATVFMVILSNYTSDVSHPDNLYLLHAGVTLLLTIGAVRRPSAARTALALLCAGLGVFAKQVAALSAVGAALGIAVAHVQRSLRDRERGITPRAVLGATGLVALGGAVALAAVGVLWSLPWSRFYTYDLVSAHGVQWGKLAVLLNQFRYIPSRLLVVLFCLGGLTALAARRGRPLPLVLAPYLTLFLFEVSPTVLPFLKAMGGMNNLPVIEVWLTVFALPWLAHVLRGRQTVEGPAARSQGAVVMFAAVAFVLYLIPPRNAPTAAHYRYCLQLEHHIQRDLEAGKRVLLAHGTSLLIRSGQTQPPLDRANSCLELTAGHMEGLAHTRARVEARHYDTIYWNSTFYPLDVCAAIERNYRDVGLVPGTPDLGLYWNYDNLMRPVRVLERRP